MFQYQEHELLCVNSFTGRFLTFAIHDILLFGDANKKFSSKALGYTSSFPVDLLYGEGTRLTNQTKQSLLGKEKVWLKEHFIRDEDFADAISDIYTTGNNKNESLRTDKDFCTLTRYFKKWLDEVLETSRVPKEKLAFVFIVKDEWLVDSEKCSYSLGPGIVDNLLKPLLQNAVSNGQSDSVKVLFMSQLEAWILYYQFRVLTSRVTGRPESSGELLKLIKSESRCLMYTLIRDNGAMELRLTYFQLIEDYNLRLFDEKYNAPKIEYMKSNSNFNAIDFKGAMEQLVIRQHLKADHLLNTPQGDYLRKISDMIIDIVFENIIGRLNKSRLQKRSFTAYRLTLEKHLSESQINLINSNEFCDTVMKDILKLLSTLLSEIAEYIEAENNKVPYFKKSIIVCKRGERSFEDTIFFALLQELIQNRPMYRNAFKWCFLPEDPYIADLNSGAAVSLIRKTMIQNMELPPIIMEKHQELNEIGRPYFYPIGKGKKADVFSPESIIYIDILLHRTDVVLETVNNKHDRMDDRIIIAIQDSNLSSFESFFESKLCNTANTLYQLNETLQDLLNEMYSCQSIINKPAKVAILESSFESYIRSIFDYVNIQLGNQDVQLMKSGYVLSLEKLVMNALQMKSKADLFAFLHRNAVIDLKENPRKLIVVDPGEKISWYMLKEIKQRPAYYYIHSRISDSYIYLKLHQVVDMSDSQEDNAVRDSPAIFIKDRTIPLRNVYEQASENMWKHIQSLSNREKDEFVNGIGVTSIDNINDFKLFKQGFIRFLKKKLFCDQNIQKNHHSYDATHRFKSSSNTSIATSIRQLIQIAIIPVIQCIVCDIITCLLDMNVFGHYDIALLIITGNCLCIQDFNEGYHHIITQEMIKALKELIRRKTYKTKFKILVDTCNRSQPSPKIPSKQKLFCYDIFTKGELRIVSSTTYFLSDRYNRFREYFEIATPWKYEKSYSLVLRGHEYGEERIKIKFLRRFERGDGVKLVLFKYTEPCNSRDIINAHSFSEINPTIYLLTDQDIQFGDLVVIQIEQLFYRSCIKITCEKYSTSTILSGQLIAKSFLLGERLSLKYV